MRFKNHLLYCQSTKCTCANGSKWANKLNLSSSHVYVVCIILSIYKYIIMYTLCIYIPISTYTSQTCCLYYMRRYSFTWLTIYCHPSPTWSIVIMATQLTQSNSLFQPNSLIFVILTLPCLTHYSAQPNSQFAILSFT